MMTPKQAYAILEDMYSLELAEPEAMAVIKSALSTPSMEDDFVKELRAENERLRLSEAEHVLQYKFLQDKIYDITNNKDK